MFSFTIHLFNIQSCNVATRSSRNSMHQRALALAALDKIRMVRLKDASTYQSTPTIQTSNSLNAAILSPGSCDRKSKNLNFDFRSDIFCPKSGEPREQINGITAFIDGSNIYGSDDVTSVGLRAVKEITVTRPSGSTIVTYPGARLKTHDHHGPRHLPSRSQCGFAVGHPNPTEEDLTSGDVRAVVQPTLTSIHTLFLNEHNRIVKALELLVETNAKTKHLPPYMKENFIFEVS